MTNHVIANLPVGALCPICDVRLTAANTQKVDDPSGECTVLICIACNPWDLLEVR